jgi:hypothetical protein
MGKLGIVGDQTKFQNFSSDLSKICKENPTFVFKNIVGV